VVDAIDLVFVQQLEELSIERLRRRKIGAERFFDDQAAPCAILLAGNTRLAEMTADWCECRRWRREIEEPVAACGACAFDAREFPIEPLICCRVVGSAVDITGAGEQLRDDPLVDVANGKLTKSLRQIVRKASLDFSPRAVPMIAKPFGNRPAAARL
jgi:hypothetical protein